MSIPVTVNGLPPFHPGEYLREILEELDLSQAEFAKNIGVSPMRISHIVRETRPVTADLALRFGKAFGQSAQFWINLQSAYDLKLAERKFKSSLARIKRLAA
jgi:addiction module HigA family antidote